MSNTVSFTVNSEASLVSAIDSADAQTASGTTFVINVSSGAAIGLNADLPAVNLVSGNSLVINGNGATLRGDGNERGLFVYAGTVEIANLTINDTAAVGGSGGNGWEGGGGGAGLGGGLFVGANAVVATDNLNLVANSAIGGNGGRANGNGYYGLGGGGGMGGGGGTAGQFGYTFAGNRSASGGGGGGVGRGAQGYSSGVAPGAGIIQGVTETSGRIYTAAGGGGGGLDSGGGVNALGQSGGFGGGGGPYGNGGFGGGAGAFGKTGGWGGGGSGGSFPGPAGFGGGGGQNGGYQSAPTGYGYYGSYYRRVPGKANGGGGLGAGGNLFVQQGGVLLLSGGGNLLGGVVTGGQPGGGNAGPGGALGSAAFLQGYGVLYLDPTAGQTLTVAGSIADQLGAGYGPTVQGSGTLAVSGAGTVVLTAASSFTGGTAMNGGTLAVQNAGALGSGVVYFAAGQDSVLDLGAVPSNTIANFGFGDTIILAAHPASVSYSQAQHTLSFSGGTLNFDPATAPARIAYDPTTGAVTAPCFAAGTGIATARGLIAVERLAIGDAVHLAEGGTAPVVWLGHRRVDCRRHSRPADVLPVRIAAHAFGLGRPAHDVFLSPDHAVFVDGVLIPVRYLLNDATLRQERAAHVTYWHVELDRHAVLLADGLPAESYLDTGNRAAFANGGAVVMAQPEFARGVWAEAGCAKLVTQGPLRDRVYARLIAQALALGWRMTDAGGGAVDWHGPHRRAG